jgi:hypothetical protein
MRKPVRVHSFNAPALLQAYPAQTFQNEYALQNFRKNVLDNPKKLKSALRKPASHFGSDLHPASVNSNVSEHGGHFLKVPMTDQENNLTYVEGGRNENEKAQESTEDDLSMNSEPNKRRTLIRRHETFAAFDSRPHHSAPEDEYFSDANQRRKQARVTFWTELEVKNMATGGIRVQTLRPSTSPTPPRHPGSVRRHESDICHSRRPQKYSHAGSAEEQRPRWKNGERRRPVSFCQPVKPNLTASEVRTARVEKNTSVPLRDRAKRPTQYNTMACPVSGSFPQKHSTEKRFVKTGTKSGQ